MLYAVARKVNEKILCMKRHKKINVSFKIIYRHRYEQMCL